MNNVEDRLEDAASELHGQLRHLNLGSAEGLIRRQHRRRSAARVSAVAALAVLTIGVLALRSHPASTPVGTPSPVADSATAPATPVVTTPESTIAGVATPIASTPPGGCPSTQNVTLMPSLIGLTVEQAKAALAKACITASFTFTETGAPGNAPAYPSGIVGAQTPAVGIDVASAPDGPSLTIYSKLPGATTTPKVVPSTTPANATPITPVSGANG